MTHVLRPIEESIVMKAMVSLCCAVLMMLVLAPVRAEEPSPGAPRNIIHYDLNSKRFELSDYLQVVKEYPPIPSLQSPVLLVFGAHWCEPCKELMKVLATKREALDAAKVTVVYIHIDDVDLGEFQRDSKAIKVLVKEMASGEAYARVRILLAGDLQQAQAWMDDPGFNALPGAVMLDQSGRVLERTGLKDFEGSLARFIAALAAQASPEPVEP